MPETTIEPAVTTPGYKRHKLTQAELCKALYRFMHGTDPTDEELTRSSVFQTTEKDWGIILKVEDAPV